MNIIDRRPNPKGKSLPNRQRFLERAKHEIKDAMTEALKRRKVGQNGSGEKVSIPSHRINEPVLRKSSQGGKRDYVVPGNKEFVVGDRIKRPQGGGEGGGGKASPEDGGEQDSFEFVLTREEFLNLFFDDLELPDLIKTKINDQESTQLVRAGYSVAGSPSALSVKRTMRNSFARRISLNRPTQKEIAALETQVETALAADDAEAAEQSKLALEAARRKSRRVPYIDPVDVRYNRFERIPKPNTQAVMFCLMDVSGSMTEQMKDLAKRFFMLLHVFLTRRYKHVDIVFIRHTSSAQEVDEDTFFHSRETGGTIVSTALDEMMRVVKARYNPENWNIYAAQASDGDNYTEDSDRCASLMAQQILPVSQYFAYIEVGAEATLRHGYPSAPTDLWRTYEGIAQTQANFAMRKVADPSQIFPVFHELFSKQRERAA
ncbi:MAG TPA: YeaH/YhbH family protein [Stellaceae bacterium]|nr:YeaH/YhbH family protein [Stellaceae bacterium]